MALPLFSQKDTINITQMMQRIEAADSTALFEDLVIYPEYNGVDSTFSTLLGYYIPTKDEIRRNRVTIDEKNKSLIFNRCHFYELPAIVHSQLKKLEIQNSIFYDQSRGYKFQLGSSDIEKLVVKNTDFNNGDISINGNEITFVNIGNSKANSIFHNMNVFNSYEISDCSINNLSYNFDTIDFSNRLNFIYDLRVHDDGKIHFMDHVFTLINSTFHNIQFNGVDFTGYEKVDTSRVRLSVTDLNIENVTCNELEFFSTHFSKWVYIGGEVTSGLIIDSVYFDEYVDLSRLNIHPGKSYIQWESLSNKISLQGTYLTNDDIIYGENPILYFQLTSTYYSLLNLYKYVGNNEYANACYVEVKDIETKRLKYVYDTEGGFDNWLNWQLNVFLKYFALYGTSPIRALIVSIWVILFFSVFYFFTATSWDNINRRTFVSQSKKMMTYFRSEQRLEDFYSEDYRDEILEYEDFKVQMAESKSEIPLFFMFLMRPLYLLVVVKHRFNSWLYRRMEILSGRWVDLTPKRKFYTGSVVVISTIGYLIYLLVVRSLNSIILSLNAFSTLGFGEIPVHGFMRYITIIEGFIGWFLLSIFSVSLISQIIQG